MQSSASPASIPTWLGLGGLIPFAGLAVGAVVSREYGEICSRALLGYGVVILSFVGALHWGFAMTLGALGGAERRRVFIWSVLPALLAWIALLMRPQWGFALLVGGFLAHYWRDIRLAGKLNSGALPDWYLPLRTRLTIGACVCLAVGGFAVR
jgi:hypothetical protein